jgi:biopolymer transport protein ExbD
MAVSTPSQASINVTPLIDVLLVLLIIFMVIAPTRDVGLPALVPQPAPEAAAPPEGRRDVVLMVRRGGIVEVNMYPAALSDLQARLTAIFGGSALATIFISGEDDLEYGEVARVIDLARGAGISRIGFLPRRS